MERLINIDNGGTGGLVCKVNSLTTDGAAGLVVATGDGVDSADWRVRITDCVRSRRISSSVPDSFRHPAVERFLYNAEDRLRSHRVKNPLLIYRNDGASTCAGKSSASSGGGGKAPAILPALFAVGEYALVFR